MNRSIRTVAAVLTWSALPVLCFAEPSAAPASAWGDAPFTFAAWMKTDVPDTVLLSSSAPAGQPGWKDLHIRGAELMFSGFTSGEFRARKRVNDNQWHHVAFVADPVAKKRFIYIDGEPVAADDGEMKPDAPGATLKIGRGFEDADHMMFTYVGQMDDVRLHGRALAADELKVAMAGNDVPAKGAPALRIKLDGEPAEVAALGGGEALKFVDGKIGRAADFSGWGYLEVAPKFAGARWVPCAFRLGGSPEERAREKDDGLQEPVAGPAAQAARYVALVERRCPALAADARRAADGIREIRQLERLREVYLKSNQWFDTQMLAVRSASAQLTQSTNFLAQAANKAEVAPMLQRANELARQAAALREKPDAAVLATWSDAFASFQPQVVRQWLLARGIGQLAFIKRNTYNSNHYYTEYINGGWMPGGNLCVMNLKDGSVKELLPDMSKGMFERFDVSFDAKKMVFAWKSGAREGHRIYEVNVDGTGLRQLTFPPADEAELVKRYGQGYHHGTDDMSPCYLPDGGIAFVSTRCQYGTLCDAPDDFTTTVVFRMDADGKNMRQLTTSALSEQTPSVLEDGRLLYSRWEYVDKGAVSVKCLWVMRPDGSGSAEVYGNDIAFPTSMVQGRGIPGTPDGYVFVGTPHYPQNAVGTVVRLDMRKNIRSREPMTYMTPYTDIRAEAGFEFQRADGSWYRDARGGGPLFRDPYPLSKEYFLVAHKPAGVNHPDPKAYGLYLLDEKGGTQLLYKDPAISCWVPYPLVPRKVPPVLISSRDTKLAQAKLARCVVTDVYHGLENVARGTIKYIRVLEQRPRPWTARRYYEGDDYDQQHAVVSKDAALGLKVQHGIVPVEDDGSANFLVPADASIYLQVLDENYMAVQTERTYVNYMAGETRSCIGCHETPQSAARAGARTGTPKALLRAPSTPGPQPGEKDGHRALDYAQDVQPVWDKHCLSCHSGKEIQGRLNLSGEMTTLFSVSFENLVPERRKGNFDRGVLGPVIGENHPKTGNVDYLPARSLGSHASVLVAMLSHGKVKLADPRQAARAEKLIEVHKDVKLTPEELIRVTNWVDVNGQYYGSYWGRRNLEFKGRPDFRPKQTFEMATSNINPFPSWQEK